MEPFLDRTIALIKEWWASPSNVDFFSWLTLMGMLEFAAIALLSLVAWNAWRLFPEVIKHYKSAAEARKIQAAAFYSELDRFYADILRIAIEYPFLRQPRAVAPDSRMMLADYDPYPDDPHTTIEDIKAKQHKCAQYDAYAFMVWNFLETIHDRCHEHPNLYETWATIVSSENRLHRGWFLQQMRVAQFQGHTADKFCLNFRVFIVDCNFLPDNDMAKPLVYSKWPYDNRDRFSSPPVFV